MDEYTPYQNMMYHRMPAPNAEHRKRISDYFQLKTAFNGMFPDDGDLKNFHLALKSAVGGGGEGSKVIWFAGNGGGNGKTTAALMIGLALGEKCAFVNLSSDDLKVMREAMFPVRGAQTIMIQEGAELFKNETVLRALIERAPEACIILLTNRADDVPGSGLDRLVVNFRETFSPVWTNEQLESNFEAAKRFLPRYMSFSERLK